MTDRARPRVHRHPEGALATEGSAPLTRLAVLLPALHALAVVVVLSARRVLPAGSMVDTVGLLAELAPWLFLPLPLWLLTAGLARRRAALAAAALPWLLFAALYGRLYLRAGPESVARGPLRVMTFNLMENNGVPGEAVELVGRERPDVVLVQELGHGAAAVLAAGLAADYPHQRLRPSEGYQGRGVLSRHPLLGEEVWDGELAGARAQQALVDLNGRRLRVVNLHLVQPQTRVARIGRLPVGALASAAERRRGVALLVPRLRALAAGPEPLVVGGDLNLTDQTLEHDWLVEAGLQDAHAEVGRGLGLTFPNSSPLRLGGIELPPWPIVRIDYVLHSRRLEAVRSAVMGRSGGSDHRALVVDLRDARER